MTPLAAKPPTSRPISARLVLFVAVASVLALGVAYAPRHELARPQSDGDVVAHVPPRSAGDMRALEALRLDAQREPDSLRSAVALSRAYIEASRREGDPRYLGAAEAALSRWTARPSPPPAVLLLRATLLQARHDFDGALADLDRALAAEPGNAQAWLTRATVATVKGRYEDARASCEALRPLTSPAVAIACRAPIDALTGRAAAARSALEGALRTAASPADRTYLHSLAGEQAFWRGDLVDAEAQLSRALALDASDRYTRALYADVLLDLGRADDAQKLVRDRGEDDALSLRAALADLALGRGETAQVVAVAAGFDATRMRGDFVHQREEARLWLARGDPARALRYALDSWAVQHEVWDARLVLEAAHKTGNRDAARPVLAWLEATGIESPPLRARAADLLEIR